MSYSFVTTLKFPFPVKNANSCNNFTNFCRKKKHDHKRKFQCCKKETLKQKMLLIQSSINQGRRCPKDVRFQAGLSLLLTFGCFSIPILEDLLSQCTFFGFEINLCIYFYFFRISFNFDERSSKSKWLEAGLTCSATMADQHFIQVNLITYIVFNLLFHVTFCCFLRQNLLCLPWLQSVSLYENHF